MARARGKVHFMGAPGTGRTACGLQRYYDATRVARDVTCVTCRCFQHWAAQYWEEIGIDKDSGVKDSK